MISIANVHRRTVPPERVQVDAAIIRAVDFLAHRQLPYGEFKTYAASDKLLKRNVRFDSSPFVTAWVVDCLASWKAAQVRTMTKRAIRFLQAEMEGPGVWRYWSSRNESHSFLPPDVDDTCCVSLALRGQGRLTSGNRGLVLANRNPDGLFFTWMVPREDMPKRITKVLQPLIDPGAQALWSMQGILDNIDPGVNANAVLYLDDRVETRAAIAFLIDIICGRRVAGVSFYPNALTLYYLVSRAYAHGVQALGDTRNAIIENVLAQQDRSGAFGNELMTAFGICTLLNFDRRGPELDRAVQSLLKAQRTNGGWRRAAAFLGPAPNYGSEELTTANCIQALARYYRTAEE